MSLNLAGVTTNFWYAQFLLTIGKQQEALRVVETIARHAPDNLNAQLIFALFLYAARQHERALEVAGAAGRMNQRHWAPCFLYALNALALGKPDDAGLEFRETSLTIGDINDQPVFPGFTLFTDLHEGDFKQASYSYSLFKEKKFPSAIDTVMFYMAKEMDDDAVKELDSLRAQPCPIICWLHLWPLFDLLRENPNFKRLLVDMNLPSHS
jgi:tetratricopeptide (TPR) repeat protein